MSASDVPKFACQACGREFRWRRELAGKRAKCVCGTVVPVPANEPMALEPEAAAASDREPTQTAREADAAHASATGPVAATAAKAPDDDPFAIGAFRRAAAAPPKPAPTGLPQVPAATSAPSASSASPAPSVPASLIPPPPPKALCPVCGGETSPGAVLCPGCGYNFFSGLRTIGYGRKPDPHEAKGGGSIAADTYQLAARAAWVAPVVGLALGCFVISAFAKAANTLGGALAIVQSLLLLAGLGLGLFALTGIKRNGREGILVPAIIGMSLSGLLLSLGVVVTVMQKSGKDPLGLKARAAAAAERPKGSGAKSPAEAERIWQESFNAPGWFGTESYNGAEVTLISVADTSPLAMEVLPNLGTPASIVILNVDNTDGTRSLNVDPTGGRVYLKDGTSRPLPDVVRILQSLKKDRHGMLLVLSPPFDVLQAGKLSGKFVFVPPATDLQDVAAISIKIDGAPVKIPGKILSAQQKQSAMAPRPVGKK